MLWENTRTWAKTAIDTMLELPEVRGISIKGAAILEPGAAISAVEMRARTDSAIALCRHDEYSDVDIRASLRLNPGDISPDMPFYAARIARLGLGEPYGMNFTSGVETQCIRLCLANGARMDISCDITPAPGQPRCTPATPFTPEQLRALNVHFIQIQALGKLMRGDYLIADHLALELAQETLVIQMQLRDIARGANFHRYGYRESLTYAQETRALADIPSAPDSTFSSIAALLYSSGLAFEYLYPQLSSDYQPQTSAFQSLFSSYISL